jgi:tetratricopeptide (TPR) repeat protein
MITSGATANVNLRGERLKKFMPAALLASLCALAFSPSLFNGFTNWDDQLYLTRNPAVTSLAPASIAHMFSGFHRGLYKPLVFLSYAVEYHFCGLNPAIYHLDNLIFHIFNALLVYWLFLLLVGERRIAFCGALLFAVHPLRVESVAWIPERKDMLCAFFALAALVCHIYYRLRGARRLRVASAALLALSMLSNAKAVMFPFIVAAVDIYAGYASLKKALKDAWPYFAVVAVFGLLNYFALMSASAAGGGFAIAWSDIFVASYGLLVYAGRTFWPFGLSVFYPYPKGYPVLLPAAYLAAPLVAAFIIWGFYRLFRNERTALFGGAFFLIYIFPFLQWLPVQPGVAMEHLSYFPAIGLSLALGVGCVKIYDACAQYRAALKAAFCALVLLLCFLTFQRTRVWKDSFTLWTDRIAHHADSYEAYTYRGMAYLEAGRWQEAAHDFDAAIAVNPKFRAAFVKRGFALFALNRYDEALADAQHALDLSGGMLDRADAAQIITEACGLKGSIYLRRGDLKNALASFNSALASNKTDSYALAGEGQIAMASGNYQAAIALYGRAVQNEPLSADKWNALGAAQAASGDYASAFASFDKSISLNTAYGAAHFNKAAACLNSGNIPCAREELDAAEKTGFVPDPKFVAVLESLGRKN